MPICREMVNSIMQKTFRICEFNHTEDIHYQSQLCQVLRNYLVMLRTARISDFICQGSSKSEFNYAQASGTSEFSYARMCRIAEINYATRTQNYWLRPFSFTTPTMQRPADFSNWIMPKTSRNFKFNCDKISRITGSIYANTSRNTESNCVIVKKIFPIMPIVNKFWIHSWVGYQEYLNSYIIWLGKDVQISEVSKIH